MMPVSGEFISTAALNVSISAISSPLITLSPSFLCHLKRVASSTFDSVLGI
jgi:hypothetical protein